MIGAETKAAARWAKLAAYSHGQDKAERAKRLLETHSTADVAAILGVTIGWVNSIRRRGFKIGKAGRPLPERPGDFAIQCDIMTVHELAAHYGVWLGTVAKWLVGVDRRYRQRRVYEGREAPPQTELRAIIAAHGVSGALKHYAVAAGTPRKWRARYGMPIAAPRVKRQPQTKVWDGDRFRIAA